MSAMAEVSERYTTLAALPFRMKNRGSLRFIEYDVMTHTGRRIPEEVVQNDCPGKGWVQGHPTRDGKPRWVRQVLEYMKLPNTIREGEPSFAQIAELMQMYRELEATVAGLRKERDEMAVRLAEVTGELERSEKRTEEYKRRANGKKE